MFLSQKAIAVFGQVKVQLKETAISNVQYTDLFTLYKAGWWITERFGTLIYITRKKGYKKDEFCLLVKRIKTDVNLDTFDSLWQEFAEKQHEKYKDILEKHKEKTIRLKKVNIND